MSTFIRLGLALSLSVGLFACANDIEDPQPAEPGVQSFTPVTYEHSGDAPAAVPTQKQFATVSGTIDGLELPKLQAPAIPKPSNQED